MVEPKVVLKRLIIKKIEKGIDGYINFAIQEAWKGADKIILTIDVELDGEYIRVLTSGEEEECDGCGD